MLSQGRPKRVSVPDIVIQAVIIRIIIRNILLVTDYLFACMVLVSLTSRFMPPLLGERI